MGKPRFTFGDRVFFLKFTSHGIYITGPAEISGIQTDEYRRTAEGYLYNIKGNLMLPYLVFESANEAIEGIKSLPVFAYFEEYPLSEVVKRGFKWQ